MNWNEGGFENVDLEHFDQGVGGWFMSFLSKQQMVCNSKLLCFKFKYFAMALNRTSIIVMLGQSIFYTKTSNEAQLFPGILLYMNVNPKL